MLIVCRPYYEHYSRAEMAGQGKEQCHQAVQRREQSEREKARQTFDTTGKVVQFLANIVVNILTEH